MNFNSLKSILLASILITSCGSDDDGGEIARATGEIGGDVTTSTVYVKGDYVLNGALKIKNGVTVTFEAGSVITANGSNGVDFISVENGGKIICNGTATEPIVFTETSKVPGSWGGIIIYGDAPMRKSGGITTATSEDGQALPYGGTNATHNGGVLRYVRVEYAGKKITDGTSEMNGFSFYSVGSGTVLENLVSYKGADDGFEFYGGTASMRNAISYGNSDDSFDWQDGWQGQNNSNWFAYQTVTGNFGMEIEASSSNNEFYPVINNITLKREAGTQPESAGSVEYDAIQFKKEGNGYFNNLKISGYAANALATACRIQDANTNTNQVNGSKIKLTQVKIEDAVSQYAGAGTVMVNFPTGNFTTDNAASGASIPSGNWAVVEGTNLLSNL